MPARRCQFQFVLALCMSLPWVSGCGSHNFDVVRTAEASLSAGDDTGAMSFAAFSPVMLLADQTMMLQHVARRQLAEIRVHAATITVKNPGSTQDLTFLAGMDVVIAAPGLPDKTLATGSGFAAGQNMGVLQVVDADFVDYFSQTDPTLKLTGQGQAPADLTLEAEIAFALHVSSNTILFQ